MGPRPVDDEKSHIARSRRARSSGPSYLRDLVYGAIDGTVTTLAVVAGVAGAGLGASIVVILGTANLLADGFSMAASNFLGTRAEEQLRDRIKREEGQHIELVPPAEREKVRQVLAGYGLEGEVLERATDAITTNRARWVDFLLLHEHGLAPDSPSAWRAAAATFVAFVVVGFVPLLAFVVDALPQVSVPSPLAWSVTLTAVTFFVVGALKGLVVDQTWWRSGLQTLAVGGTAAGLAYGVGTALGGIA